MTNPIVSRLLLNPDIDNAQRGVLEPATPLQKFAKKEWVLWQYPLNGLSPGTTGDLIVIDKSASGAISGPLWDSVNKWVYTNFQVANSTQFVRAVGVVGDCPVDLLPQFSVGCAHVETASGEIRLGMGDAAFNADPANGLFFRSIAGANWRAVARKGGVEGTFDTGVAAGTKPRHFMIKVTGPTAVEYYIDGARRAMIASATTVPASGTLLLPRVGLVGTALASINCRFTPWFAVRMQPWVL